MLLKDPRLSIRLSTDQYVSLQKLLPWGVKNAIFSAIVDEVIRIYEAEGYAPFAKLVTGKSKLEIK